MRHIHPRWPRQLGFLLVLALMWWGLGALPEGAEVPWAGRSLFPPAVAILVAFWWRRVALALFLGIATAAFMATSFAPAAGLERLTVGYLWTSATDPWNLKVYAFTLVLIGMINVSIACGGIEGVLDRVGVLARGPRSTQGTVALMGVAVFFDDYANSVVVGGAARPLADRGGISREKLAYIVDSTSAPIAGLALVSTWIAVEIAYFQDALAEMSAFGDQLANGYAIFLGALPMRFYCIFCVILVLLVAWTGRDLGPMRRAEAEARQGRPTPGSKRALDLRGQAVMKEGTRPRWVNGVLPILVVVGWVIAGFALEGQAVLAAKGVEADLGTWAGFKEAFIHVDDSVTVLLEGALIGTATAVVLASVQRLLGPVEALAIWLRGALSMLPAILVLFLAMTIQMAVKDVKTAPYMATLLGDVSPFLLPLATFVLASLVAFATGTSYGTMGILIPIVLPVGASLFAGLDGGLVLLLLLAASVLDGAIFGDHCSPISDTTVLSSVASGCEHVEHVRTQLPYALTAMITAALAGYAMVAWSAGGLLILAYPLGVGLMVGLLYLLGRRAAPPEAEGAKA